MSTEETGKQQQSSTSPPADTKDATAPPANPEVDQDAVEKGQENIEKISGN